MNEEHSLVAGSGVSWMKRWKEKLRAAFDYWIILVVMGDSQIVPPCGWKDPTHKSASELQKLCEVMGVVIAKSTSTFTAF